MAETIQQKTRYPPAWRLPGGWGKTWVVTTERNAEPVYSDRILTVPNVLSAIRLIGVPVFLWLLLVKEADGWAFALLVASGFTDFLDGKLARLLDQSSKLGAILDPLVDRLYLLATLAGFLIRGILPWWVVLILVARDGILTLTLGIYKRRRAAPARGDLSRQGRHLRAHVRFAVASRRSNGLAPGRFRPAFGGAFLVWGTAVYVWTGILYLGKAVAVYRAIPAAAAPPIPAPSSEDH